MLIKFVIYFSVSSSFIYFLYRNRIDFLLVFFLSTTLYHWQIIGGKIIVPPYKFEASDESIIIISTIFLIHTLITIFHDFIVKNKITFNNFNTNQNYNLIAYVLCFISLILTFRGLYIVGFDFILKGEYSKALTGANINPIWLHYPAAMSLVYSTVTKNRNLFILSFIPLLVYGYMGYRAELVTALVGCITIYAFNSKFNSLKFLTISFLVIILFLFFSIYKITYYDLRDDSVTISERFESRVSFYGSTSNLLKKTLFYNEWGQISSNLSLSTEKDLSKYYDLPTTVIGSLPFVKRFSDIKEDDVRFSRVILEHANPGFSYKLGGSFWAEAYAGLNIIGVILFSILVSITIAFLNNVFYRSNPIFLFSTLFLSFLSFYIHRNDLTLVFAHFKNMLFLLIVAGSIFILFKFIRLLLLNLKETNY